MRKQIHNLRRILLILLSLAFFYSGACAFSIWDYGKKDEAQPADAAIILGAGTLNGAVSPVFRERINHGISLYQRGYVKKLIFTGGFGAGSTSSDAAAAGAYAVSQGIPRYDILLEEESTVTLENLKNAKQIMDTAGLRTAMLVSDPLHMKRAMLMAEDIGLSAFSSPTPTTRYVTLKTRLAFLGRELFYYLGYKIYRLL